MSNASAMKSINEQMSASFFGIHTEKCVTAGGKVIPGKKVICRTDNGSPISVVSEKYKVVTNEEVFTTFTSVLEKANLNLEGAIVKPEFSHGGARTFAQIILPEHQITVGEKDPTALRLIAKNSYDGSTSFIVQAGGYRFVCSNGQIRGDNISYFKSKHVESLDLAAAAQHMAGVINTFEDSKEFYEDLRTKAVSDKQAYACLAYASRNNEAFRVGYVAYEEMSPTMKKLFDSWKTHQTALGKTAWALYNTMTHFASHWGEDKNSKNGVASKFYREDRVRETLGAAVWKKIAA